MKALAILALLASSVVQAAPPTVTVTWTAPLTNDDGSTPANVMGYNVYRSSTLPVPVGGTVVPISKGTPLPATTLTYIDAVVPAGTWYYAVTAWGCKTPTTSPCVESLAGTSGAITVVNTPPTPATPSTPGKPGSVTVTVNGVQAP
jgi:hypothetical protein